MKISVPEYCLKLPVRHFLFWHKSERKDFSIEVPSWKWSAGQLVKVLFQFLKHVKENFMHYWNILFLFKFLLRMLCKSYLYCMSVGLAVVCVRYLAHFGVYFAFRSGPWSSLTNCGNQGSHSVISNKPRLFMKKKHLSTKKNRNAKRRMNVSTWGKTVIKILIYLKFLF